MHSNLHIKFAAQKRMTAICCPEIDQITVVRRIVYRPSELYVQVLCSRCNAYRGFYVDGNLKIKVGEVRPEKGNLVCLKCGHIVGMYMGPERSPIERTKSGLESHRLCPAFPIGENNA